MNKQLIYFPSLSFGIPRDYFSIDRLLNDKSTRFYISNDIFYHPYFLISAGSQYKNINCRKDWNLNNSLVLGDSGGYQIATGKLKYKEELIEQIFNWLENNSDIAINLDIPPTKLSNNFENSLKISKENFKYFNTHQTGKTKFLNVLQGNNINQYETWYNEVKHFNFNGWAFGGNLNKILYVITYFLEQKEFNKPNINYIHILGRGNPFDFTFFHMIQKFLNLKYNNKIQMSCDNSSPGMISAYGDYVYDINWEKLNFKLIHIHKQLKDKIKLPCDCFYCKDRTYNDFEKWNMGDYMSISMHNLKLYIEALNKTQILINQPEDVIKNILNSDFFKLHEIIKEIFNSNHPIETYNKNINIINKLLGEKEKIQANDNKINDIFDF